MYSSHLLLQQAETERLNAEDVSSSEPAATKALMSLHYSRRMAWDMIRVMIEKIENEDDLPCLPFAGVCCVIRAAIAVLETGQDGNVDMPNGDEITGFLKILGWFARRWSVGGGFCHRPFRFKLMINSPIPRACMGAFERNFATGIHCFLIALKELV